MEARSHKLLDVPDLAGCFDKMWTPDYRGVHPASAAFDCGAVGGPSTLGGVSGEKIDVGITPPPMVVGAGYGT